jgi:3-deoxy-D-manno-octulosonate 8-phosphate phosphatase (KDO 8-P phosphatase)
VARLTPRQITQRAARLRLVLFDVDGVLTDGRLSLSASGDETKQFHIRDGAAIVWAERAGLMTGLLSVRVSRAAERRAAELGMRVVWLGVSEKREGYAEILASHDLRDDEVAYMGDDLMDLPVLTRVGLSAAPADAVDLVRQRVHWTSRAAGGAGAARELVELILRARGDWDATVRQYLRR